MSWWNIAQDLEVLYISYHIMNIKSILLFFLTNKLLNSRRGMFS